MKAKVIKPDSKEESNFIDDIFGMPENPTIFLAGSIENGKAEKWQDKLVEEFKELDVTFYNPRREQWNSEWSQSTDNKELVRQIEWELLHLDKADYICMYFDPNTTSPITLLELGIHINNPKLFVCCPDGYYRKANVKVTCAMYGVPLYDTYDELLKHLKVIIEERLNQVYE